VLIGEEGHGFREGKIDNTKSLVEWSRVETLRRKPFLEERHWPPT
jgi:hypothetical protein